MNTFCTFGQIAIRVYEHQEAGMRTPGGSPVNAAGRMPSKRAEDEDRKRQKRDLEAIYRDASCSPYFHRNPKWCKGKYKNRLPYISYADVKGNEYVIRAAPSGFTPQSYYDGDDPVLVRYGSIDEVVEDGWRLD